MPEQIKRKKGGYIPAQLLPPKEVKERTNKENDAKNENVRKENL